MSIALEAQLRQKDGQSLKALRQAGAVPGMIYGPGIDNTSVSVNAKSFSKVFKEAGENTLVDLIIEGQKSQPVIIHDIQFHPVTGQPAHVDYLAVRLDKKVKAKVPVVFVGESLAMKDFGGILLRNAQEIEVEALPQNLPHNIEINLSLIKTFEDHIKISDIKIPPSVKILDEAEKIVASVMPPRTESELESLKEEVTEDISKVEGVVKPEKTEPAPEEDSKKE